MCTYSVRIGHEARNRIVRGWGESLRRQKQRSMGVYDKKAEGKANFGRERNQIGGTGTGNGGGRENRG